MYLESMKKWDSFCFVTDKKHSFCIQKISVHMFQVYVVDNEIGLFFWDTWSDDRLYDWLKRKGYTA